MKILFVWPNWDDPFFKPISISLLSAILKKAGNETKCFDTSFIDFNYSNGYKATTEAKIHKKVDINSFKLGKQQLDYQKLFFKGLNDFVPDVVAFSVISNEIEIAHELSNIARQWNKEVIIIWGGKGVTVEPEKVLSFDSVNYVCVGEGIVAFPEFIKRLKTGESLDNINNIWHKKNGEIVKNNFYPLYEDFDSLPYLDWDIFDERLFYKAYEGKIYRGGDHMIAWGCPNNCTYCINDYYHQLYHGFRLQRYSVGRIINELKYLKNKYQIEFFKFWDEDFLLKPLSYLEEFADSYAKEINVPFVGTIHSRSVTKRGVDLLKKMNCVSMSIGVENGDEYLRKMVLNRNETEAQIIEAFRLLKEAGIRNLAFNMLGVPFETRETYFKTVELNRKINAQVPLISFFYPFKKTKLRQIAIDNGFYDPTDEKIWNYEKSALKFINFTDEQLNVLRKRFSLYVKFPKIFWPYIERSENLDNAGKALEKNLFEIFDQAVFANNGWYKSGKEEYYLSELDKIIRK